MVITISCTLSLAATHEIATKNVENVEAKNQRQKSKDTSEMLASKYHEMIRRKYFHKRLGFCNSKTKEHGKSTQWGHF
jgi:hypothetical protein